MQCWEVQKQGDKRPKPQGWQVSLATKEPTNNLIISKVVTLVHIGKISFPDLCVPCHLFFQSSASDNSPALQLLALLISH